MSLRSVLRAIVAATMAGVFLLCSCFNLAASKRAYFPRSEEEVGILSLIIASEIKANNWTNDESVCFSVDGLDPAPKLLKSLRQRYLNLRGSSEWTKRFNCGFELQLEYSHFDLLHNIRVNSKVLDLREINNGTGDLALLEREGEYSLQKVDGKWSVKEYSAKPLPLHSSS